MKLNIIDMYIYYGTMDYMYDDINHSTSKHENHKNYYSNFASIFIHGGVLIFRVSLRRAKKVRKRMNV